MGASRVAARQRFRWVTLFTLLLFASTAVPVLADSEAEQPPEQPYVTTLSAEAEADPSLLPDGADVAAGIAKLRAEENERAEDLADPQAIRERNDSRNAFVDLGAEEAKQLLRTLFAEQIAALGSDPARLLSDSRIVQSYAGEGGVVERGGETSLLEGALPLRIADESGELRKVDLSLRSTAEGFKPDNSLAKLTIPSSSDGPLKLGEKGIAISASDVDEPRTGQRFGKFDIFYPEVNEDTDRLVSPIAGGVEIFDLLRSERSPESMRYGLQLPKDAVLRADGQGGVEVARGGEILVRVRPPSAVDAQGADVPVKLSVLVDSIELRVPHRESDVAYPILVDPIVEDWYSSNWYNGNGLSALSNGAWQYTDNSSNFHGGTSCIHKCWGGSNRGLFVSSAPDNYGANIYGQWIYSAPNLNSFVESVSILPFWRDTDGCSATAYPRPYDYVGLYDSVNQSWTQLVYDFARYYNYANIGFSNQWPGWGHLFALGLTSHSGTSVPCWRDLYAGGALVNLDDWADPTIGSVGGIPSGWIGESTPVT